MTVKQLISKLERIKDQSALAYLFAHSGGGGAVGGPVERVYLDPDVPGRVIIETK